MGKLVALALSSQFCCEGCDIGKTTTYTRIPQNTSYPAKKPEQGTTLGNGSPLPRVVTRRGFLAEHSDSTVIELTSRIWKEKFTHEPMRPDVVR